jgi:hypothetical protein
LRAAKKMALRASHDATVSIRVVAVHIGECFAVGDRLKVPPESTGVLDATYGKTAGARFALLGVM